VKFVTYTLSDEFMQMYSSPPHLVLALHIRHFEIRYKVCFTKKISLFCLICGVLMYDFQEIKFNCNFD